MRAAVLTQINAPLEVLELEHATHHRGDAPCRNNQVLVEVIASGICGSQLQEIAGHKGAEFIPHLLGHEGVGIVKQIGPGASPDLLGKRVVMHWRPGKGNEARDVPKYRLPGGNLVGGGHVTTLAEAAVVSANRVTVVPDDVPDELCCLLGCGLSTALGTMEQEARLKFGESVLVVGCGGVGLNLIQAAKIGGAWPIVGMDITDTKSQTVCKLGAHRYINCRNEPMPTERFDVIVDTTGSPEAIEATVPLLSGTGRYVLIGQTKPGQSFRVLNAVNRFHGDGSRLIWTQGGGFRPGEMIPRYISLWRGGYLDLDSIVTHRMPLDEVNRGVELVRAGQAGRVLVSMS